MVTLDQGGWLGPDARIFAPAPILTDLVEHVFVLDMRAVTARSWRIVPDRSPHLLAHCKVGPRGSLRVSTSVVGSRSHAIDVDPAGRVWTVGLRLRPGALQPVTGHPSGGLTDSAAAFGDVWGGRGDRWSADVGSHSDPQVVAARLCALVRSVAGDESRPWLTRAFEAAVRARPRAGVSELAEALGVAPRTLRRRCYQATGLAPKRHLRIDRLHRAIDHARQRPTMRWGRIAATCGFSDQAHLVREFQSLVGEAPERFRTRGRRAVSYKPTTPCPTSFPDNS